MHAQGAKVVGICEKNSAIYNDKGLDPEDVKIYFTTNGTLNGYNRAEESTVVDPDSYIERPCDILIPAAIERTINKLNASKI